MIKPIDSNHDVVRYVNGQSYAQTAFVADGTSDITAMNADGSAYLNYPAGSAAICMEDGNVYILNAEETEYEVPGGTDE